MSSPLAVAGKILITLGLVTGVAKLGLSNATMRNDIVATRANIKTLKQETDAKKQAKLKKKVTVSDYQKAEKNGRKVAGALNKLMVNNQDQAHQINYKDPNAKLVDSMDANGNDHALLNTFPTILKGYRAQYAHSGATSSGDVQSGFLIYDGQNQIQGILKCVYDPVSHKFSNYHFVPSKALGEALNNANRQIQAQINDKLYGKPKNPGAPAARSSSVNKNTGASQNSSSNQKQPSAPATQPSKATGGGK